MNKLDAYYNRHEAIARRFRLCERRNDENGMGECRNSYQALREDVAAEGEDFMWVFRLYKEAKEIGNDCIDLHDPISDNTVPVFLDTLRKYGVNRFTFSSGWSSAVKTAWMFTKNGYILDGMTEINGNTKTFPSGEHERIPAYVFRADET